MTKTKLKPSDRQAYLERIQGYVVQLEQRVDDLIDGDTTVSPTTRWLIHHKLHRAKQVFAASRRVSDSSWPLLQPELENLLADLVAEIGHVCPEVRSSGHPMLPRVQDNG